LKAVIEVSAERLRSNFHAVQQAAGPQFQVLAVIKADAYGHDAALCAPVLVQAGARWLGVADLHEALRVRAALQDAGLSGSETSVLVMCGFEPEDAPGLVAARLTPVVWTAEHVRALERAATAAGARVAVHLEVDTGMARQGVAPGADLAAWMDALDAAPHVRCEGVFSHLSSSEIVRSPHTAIQCARFDHALEQMAPRLIPDFVHLGNSSAVDEGWTLPWTRERAGKSAAQALVRPGLALYGYVLGLHPDAGAGAAGPSLPPGQQESRGRLGPALQPVATWKTRVIGLREVAPGLPVGYGGTFVARHPVRLALLPVGYADGFRREASSGIGDGWVMIAGRRAPVVGRVSMNLTVVDITAHPGVAVGDEVVLLGDGVTAEDHARWCGTIPYEILCGMRGQRRLV
jgi:alanine racemase